MIKKLLITLLFFGFVPLFGSAATSAATDVKTRAANDADVEMRAATVVPRQFDEAASLIAKGQLGDFFQKYSEWSMSPAERAYILKYFFFAVQPPLERLQVQELAQMVYWFYRANQFDVLEGIMDALPAAWRDYDSFMELIKKAANSAEESRAAKRPKIAPEPMQVTEDVVMTTVVNPPPSTPDVHPYERVRDFVVFHGTEAIKSGLLRTSLNFDGSTEANRWLERVQAELAVQVAQEAGLSAFEKRLVYCIAYQRIESPAQTDPEKLLRTAAQISKDEFPASEKTIIRNVISMPRDDFNRVYHFAADKIIPDYKGRAEHLIHALNFLPKELRQIAVEYSRERRLGVSVAQAVQGEAFAKRPRKAWAAPDALVLSEMMIDSCEGLSGFTDKPFIDLSNNLLREIPVRDLPHSLEILSISLNPGVRFVVENDSEIRAKVVIIDATGCGFSAEYVRDLIRIFPRLWRVKIEKDREIVIST